MSGSWSKSNFVPATLNNHATHPYDPPPHFAHHQSYAPHAPPLQPQSLLPRDISSQQTRPMSPASFTTDPRVRTLQSGSHGLPSSDPRIRARQASIAAPSTSATDSPDSSRPPSRSASDDTTSFAQTTRVETGPLITLQTSRTPSAVGETILTPPVKLEPGRSIHQPRPIIVSPRLPSPYTLEPENPSSSFTPPPSATMPRLQAETPRLPTGPRYGAHAIDYKHLYQMERQKLITLGEQKVRVEQDLHTFRLKVEALERQSTKVHHTTSKMVSDFEAELANARRAALEPKDQTLSQIKATLRAKTLEALEDEELIEAYSMDLWDHHLALRQLHREHQRTKADLEVERTERVRAANDLAQLSTTWVDDKSLKSKAEDDRLRISTLERDNHLLKTENDDLKRKSEETTARFQSLLMQEREKLDAAWRSRDEVMEEKGLDLQRCEAKLLKVTEREKAKSAEVSRLNKRVKRLELVENLLGKDLKEKILELDAFRSEYGRKVTQCEAYDAMVNEITSEYRRFTSKSTLTLAKQKADTDYHLRGFEKASAGLSESQIRISQLEIEVQAQTVRETELQRDLKARSDKLTEAEVSSSQLKIELQAKTADVACLQKDFDARSRELIQVEGLLLSMDTELKRVVADLESDRRSAADRQRTLEESLRDCQGRREASEKELATLRSELETRALRCQDIKTGLGTPDSARGDSSSPSPKPDLTHSGRGETLDLILATLDSAQVDLRQKDEQLAKQGDEIDKIRSDLMQKTRECNDQKEALIKAIEQAAERDSLREDLLARSADVVKLKGDIERHAKRIGALEKERHVRRAGKVKEQADELVAKNIKIRQLESLEKSRGTQIDLMKMWAVNNEAELAGYRRVVEREVSHRRLAEVALLEQVKMVTNFSGELTTASSELKRHTEESSCLVDSLYDTIALLETDLEEAFSREMESDDRINILEVRLGAAIQSIKDLEEALRDGDDLGSALQHSLGKNEVLAKALDNQVALTVQLRRQLKESQLATCSKNERITELGRTLAARQHTVQQGNAQVARWEAKFKTANRRTMALALVLRSQQSRPSHGLVGGPEDVSISDMTRELVRDWASLLDIRDRQLAAYELALRSALHDREAREKAAEDRARKEGNRVIICLVRQHKRALQSSSDAIISLESRLESALARTSILEKDLATSSTHVADRKADLERLQLSIDSLQNRLSHLSRQRKALRGEKDLLAQENWELLCYRDDLAQELEVVKSVVETERERAWSFVETARIKMDQWKQEGVSEEDLLCSCGDKRKRISEIVVPDVKKAKLGFAEYANRPSQWPASDANLGSTVESDTGNSLTLIPPGSRSKPRLSVTRAFVKGTTGLQEVVDFTETDEEVE